MGMNIIKIETFKKYSKPNTKFLSEAKKINEEYSGSNVESFQKVLIETKFFVPLHLSNTEAHGDLPIFIKSKPNGTIEKYTVAFTSYEELEKFCNNYNFITEKILEVDYEHMNKAVEISNLNGYIIDILGSEIYINHVII